jgi:single-stranded DNA-binding protein
MNSFRLTAVGNLGRNPELAIKGDITFARFCLIGNDYAGEGEKDGPREFVTSLWFIAFGEIAESIARHSRKGDQLILEARIVANSWTDKDGVSQRGNTFIVTGFLFGATRGGHDSPIAGRGDPPYAPSSDANAAEAEEEVAV